MPTTGGSHPLFRGGEQGRAERFAQRLAELKRTGCSILVTGSVDEAGFAEQMARSFGSRDCTQVVVSPRQLTDPERLLPADVSPDAESVRVISGERARRTAAAGVGDGVSELGAVGDEALAVITELSDEFELEYNDLRVGVTSLDQLGEDADPHALTRFVRNLSQCVGLVDGTLYCQFQNTDERALQSLDASVFDAQIELRSQSGQIEQRWRLLCEEITTDWVSL